MPRSTYLRAATAASALALAATGFIAVQPAGAATVWSATSTKAPHLTHAKLLAAPSATRELSLTVGLAPRNAAGLRALIHRQNTRGSGAYHHFLTPAQFTSRYGASAGAASAVATYLRRQGVQGVHVSTNRLQVTGVATLARAERAFHTSIARYRQGGRIVLANTGPAMVPSSLAGKVTGVLGLSTVRFDAGAPTSLPKLTGYYPNEFVKVYNAGKTRAGAGTTLAVIAEGNLTQTIKDLRVAESKRGLPQVPVTLVHVGKATSDTSGADEWDLDTQTSTGAAPSASRLYIYIASSLTEADIAKTINKFAAAGVAKSGSASLGLCDAVSFLDGTTKVVDAALKEAAAQGQTFFASTGDTGSSCAVAGTNGVPGSGPTDTEYPASSPYAVAVGGTTLDTDNNDNYVSEIAWSGGGGGVSPVEPSPTWQNGVSPSATVGQRGVPDIALDADPNTGALIYVDGKVTQIGGTSLSSPLALGLWTRLQSTHGNGLGFAAPRLYKLYKGATTASPGFHDVLLGSNGVYFAAPGYDYTTGLGSLDVNALSTALG